MRTVYIDADFKCHVADDGTMMKIAENYVDAGLVLDSLCMCN